MDLSKIPSRHSDLSVEAVLCSQFFNLKSSSDRDEWRKALSNQWGQRLLHRLIDTAGTNRDASLHGSFFFCLILFSDEGFRWKLSTFIRNDEEAEFRLLINGRLQVSGFCSTKESTPWSRLSWSGDWDPEVASFVAEHYFDVQLLGNGKIKPLLRDLNQIKSMSTDQSIDYMRTLDRIDFEFLACRHEQGVLSAIEVSYLCDLLDLPKDWSDDVESFASFCSFVRQSHFRVSHETLSPVYDLLLEILRFCAYEKIVHKRHFLRLFHKKSSYIAVHFGLTKLHEVEERVPASFPEKVYSIGYRGGRKCWAPRFGRVILGDLFKSFASLFPCGDNIQTEAI